MRLRLIYPSDERRNYQKGMDRLLFDIQFEGQLHPLNIDKLRKAVNSIVRLYLEHSDAGNVIDGNSTGLSVKEILTNFVGNILTARIFSSFFYNKVMEKCSNQADLGELTSTLMSVINNCPPREFNGQEKCFNCGKMGYYAKDCQTRNVRRIGNEEQWLVKCAQ